LSLFTKDETDDNPQINLQLFNLMTMIQGLDKKLHCLNDNLGEINSNFNDFKICISSKIETFNNDISCRFDTKFDRMENTMLTRIAQSQKRLSSCTKAESIDEKQAPRSQSVTELNTLMVAKRRRSSLVYDSKSYSSTPSTDFNVKKVTKSDDEKIIISNNIKSSPYYKLSTCCDDELRDIVDAFGVEKFKPGSLILKEGDTFDRFYIVKNGTVDVFVDGEHVSLLAPKEAFDSCFMMDSISISAFRARDECEIWFLPVEKFRSISTYYKRKRLSFKTNFLKMVSRLFFLRIFSKSEFH